MRASKSSTNLCSKLKANTSINVSCHQPEHSRAIVMSCRMVLRRCEIDICWLNKSPSCFGVDAGQARATLTISAPSAWDQIVNEKATSRSLDHHYNKLAKEDDAKAVLQASRWTIKPTWWRQPNWSRTKTRHQHSNVVDRHYRATKQR